MSLEVAERLAIKSSVTNDEEDDYFLSKGDETSDSEEMSSGEDVWKEDGESFCPDETSESWSWCEEPVEDSGPDFDDFLRKLNRQYYGADVVTRRNLDNIVEEDEEEVEEVVEIAANGVLRLHRGQEGNQEREKNNKVLATSTEMESGKKEDFGNISSVSEGDGIGISKSKKVFDSKIFQDVIEKVISHYERRTSEVQKKKMGQKESSSLSTSDVILDPPDTFKDCDDGRNQSVKDEECCEGFDDVIMTDEEGGRGPGGERDGHAEDVNTTSEDSVVEEEDAPSVSTVQGCCRDEGNGDVSSFRLSNEAAARLSDAHAMQSSDHCELSLEGGGVCELRTLGTLPCWPIRNICVICVDGLVNADGRCECHRDFVFSAAAVVKSSKFSPEENEEVEEEEEGEVSNGFDHRCDRENRTNSMLETMKSSSSSMRKGSKSEDLQSQSQSATMLQAARSILKASTLKRSSKKSKKKQRVQFDESLNQFFEADYVILVRDEEYDEEDDYGTCVCGNRFCDGVANYSSREGDYFNLSAPLYEPPSEFVDPVTLSPPDGYKDGSGLYHSAIALQEDKQSLKDGIQKDKNSNRGRNETNLKLEELQIIPRKRNMGTGAASTGNFPLTGADSYPQDEYRIVETTTMVTTITEQRLQVKKETMDQIPTRRKNFGEEGGKSVKFAGLKEEKEDPREHQNQSDRPFTLTFKMGNRVVPCNSLKPNSAVRQLFPDFNQASGPEAEIDASGTDGLGKCDGKYLVTEESLRAFNEVNKRSVFGQGKERYPFLHDFGEDEDEDMPQSELLQKTIERNTLRRSMARYPKDYKRQLQPSLEERIKELTCHVDEEQVRPPPSGEERKSCDHYQPLHSQDQARRHFLSSLSTGEYDAVKNKIAGDRTSVMSVESGGTEYSVGDIDEALSNGQVFSHQQKQPDVISDADLASFVQRDASRIERLKKRYSGGSTCSDDEHDDYGFTRRPSVRGIKPRFGSTTEILQQLQIQLQPPPQVIPQGMTWPYHKDVPNGKMSPRNPPLPPVREQPTPPPPTTGKILTIPMDGSQQSSPGQHYRYHQHGGNVQLRLVTAPDEASSSQHSITFPPHVVVRGQTTSISTTSVYQLQRRFQQKVPFVRPPVVTEQMAKAVRMKVAHQCPPIGALTASPTRLRASNKTLVERGVPEGAPTLSQGSPQLSDSNSKQQSKSTALSQPPYGT